MIRRAANIGMKIMTRAVIHFYFASQESARIRMGETNIPAAIPMVMQTYDSIDSKTVRKSNSINLNGSFSTFNTQSSVIEIVYLIFKWEN